MTRRNIAAWTPVGANYPPFISVNEIASGLIELTVRGPAKPDGSCGDCVAVTMSGGQMDSVARNILAGIQGHSDMENPEPPAPEGGNSGG